MVTYSKNPLIHILFILFFMLLHCTPSLHPMEIKEEKKEAKLEIQNQTPRRLAIFLDYHNQEKNDQMNAVTMSFATNLHQEASSCIVHKTVLNKFLNQMINSLSVALKNTKGFIDKYSQQSYFYLGINFKPENWRIYHVKNTPLFVFILNREKQENKFISINPENKDQIIINQKYQFNEPEEEEEEEEEENKNIWKKYTLKPSDRFSFYNNNHEIWINLKKQLDSFDREITQNFEPLKENEKFSIEHFKKIFITNEALIKLLPQLLPDEAKQEKFLALFEDSEKNILKKIFEIKEESKIEKNASEISKKINLAHIFLGSWNVVIKGHGSVDDAIAGVDAQDFPKILDFFNNLNTKFMLIRTCSSGGKNINYLKFKNYIKPQEKEQQLQQRNLSYFLAITGIGDVPIIDRDYFNEKISVNEQGYLTEVNYDFDPSNNYIGFFNDLEKTTESGHSVSSYKKALSNLTLINDWFFSNLGINAIPQMWSPYTGWFKFWEVDKTIQRLHKITEQIQVEEESAISIKNKFAVLVESEEFIQEIKVYPNIIEPREKEPKKPAWLRNWIFPVLAQYHDEIRPYGVQDFYYPTFFPVNKEADVYFFHHITVESYKAYGTTYSGILNFIRDSFFNLQGRKKPKIFLIKKLVGFNDFEATCLKKIQYNTFYNYYEPTYDMNYYNANRNFITHMQSDEKNAEEKDGNIILENVLICSWLTEKNQQSIEILFSRTRDNKMLWWCCEKDPVSHERAWAFYEASEDYYKQSMNNLLKKPQIYELDIQLQNSKNKLYQENEGTWQGLEEQLKSLDNKHTQAIAELKISENLQKKVDFFLKKSDTKKVISTTLKKFLEEKPTTLEQKAQEYQKLLSKAPLQPPSLDQSGASAPASNPLETLKKKLTDLKTSVSKLATSLKTVNTKLEELKKKLVSLKSSS